MPSRWADLPGDVLEKIGVSLTSDDYLDDLCPARLACTTWAASIPLAASRNTWASVTGRGPAAWGSRLFAGVAGLHWVNPPCDPIAFRDAPLAFLRHIALLPKQKAQRPKAKGQLAALFGSAVPLLESLNIAGLAPPRGISAFAASSPLLASLDLSGCCVRNLSEVATITSLTSLNLTNNSVKNAGVLALARMPLLTTLDLSDNDVTDACAAHLPVSLTSLDLSDNHVRDAQLSSLCRLTRLGTLSLSGTRVTGACASSLPDSLTSLDLSCTRVDDVGAYALRLLTRLSALDVSYTRIHDAVHFPVSLTSLDVSGNKSFNGSWIASVSRLALIETLVIADVGIIDFGYEVDLPRLQTIIAIGSRVSGGLAFSGMPRLAILNVSHGRVDSAFKAAMCLKTGLVEHPRGIWSSREIAGLRAERLVR